MKLIEVPKFGMRDKMIHYAKYFPHGWMMEDTLLEIENEDEEIVGLLLYTSHEDNAYNVHIHHFGHDHFTFGKGLIEFCKKGELYYSCIRVECLAGTPFERLLRKRKWEQLSMDDSKRHLFIYRR